jgi:replication factor C large subunit
MLIEKYKPKNLSEIIGQRSLVEKILQWIENWQPKKALMLYGPTGIGKTLAVELIAKENGFNLIEISPSDDNLNSYVKEVLLPSSKEGSIFGKRLILIDDIDSISDRGLVAELIKLIKESAGPVIITASNPYAEKLRTLKTYCTLVKVDRIRSNSIEKELKRIADIEKIAAGDEMIRRIACDSDGDIRSAINDLEVINKYGEFAIRDRERDIFKTLKVVFQSGSISEALQAINESDKDIDDIFWWVEQNITLEFKSNDEISKAMDILNEADMFKSRIIVNQNYRFKKYMKEMVAGITLIGKSGRFIMYRPPDRFIALGSSKFSRKAEEDFLLGLELHCSMKKAREQAPYLKMILGEKFK